MSRRAKDISGECVKVECSAPLVGEKLNLEFAASLATYEHIHLFFAMIERHVIEAVVQSYHLNT
jgi:hypothetical protein